MVGPETDVTRPLILYKEVVVQEKMSEHDVQF